MRAAAFLFFTWSPLVPIFTMSYVAKDKEVDAPVPPVKLHKIRITLTSRNVKNLEKSMYYAF